MEDIIEAISNLAKDQGIANVISLALIWIIYNMQRGQKAETDQQNKLINQHGLTLEQLRRTTDAITETKGAVTGLTTAMSEHIKSEVASKEESKATIKRGIDTIEAHTAIVTKNTESVTNMNEQFKDLEKAIRDVLNKVEGGMTLDEKTKNEIIAEVSKNISATVHECMAKAIKSTQEIPKATIRKSNKPSSFIGDNIKTDVDKETKT